MDDRLTAPWHPLDAVPVGIAAFLATAVMGSLLFAVLEPGLALVLAGLSLQVALVVSTVLWIRFRHRDGLTDLRLSAPDPRAALARGFVAGLAIYALTVFVIAPLFYALISLITGELVDPPQQQVLPEDPETFHIVLGGLVAVLAAPIGEEIFFRGLLHTALRARMRFWAAGSISAAVFAVFHVIPLLMPLFFVVGLGLAWLYERRGTLLAPIAAHAAFNVVGFVMLVRLGT
jgi:uncharacterized protein